MTALYAIGAFLACFAFVMLLAEVLADSLSLTGQWWRER